MWVKKDLGVSDFLLVFLVICLTSGCGCDSHTPDEAMIAKFSSKRVQFEKLVTMYRKDEALSAISVYSIRPGEDHGLTDSRIKEYRKLLREIGCKYGIDTYSKRSEMEIVESVQGMSISGSVKYFVYFMKEPTDMKVLAGFKLTPQSLKNLKDEEIPENILDDLQPLENQEFFRKHEFMDAVEKQIGAEQAVQYQTLLIKYAYIPAVLDTYCANAEEEGRVFRHLEGNWYMALDIEF